ncbi:MAG: PilZ domain-containing protein [Solirubrobacteraceae bacterium]|nr:PilZ domain-containing protein [Solirubrobacteraceae bacterium]
MLFKTKPSLLDALVGEPATLRTTGRTDPAAVVAVDGKKVTIAREGSPRTGTAILICPHEEHGLVTVRGTIDRKGVLAVRDVSTSEERRSGYRVTVGCDVQVTLPNSERVECHTTDLSVVGTRLASCPRLRADDSVRVIVNLDDEVLLLKALVARADPRGGCGLRFVEVGRDIDQKLGHFVAERQRGNLSALAR